MIKFLIEKEFKQLFRNPFLPRLILVFPLTVLLFLPQAADFEIDNIDLVIIDNDQSSLSHRMVQKILSSGYFRLTESADSYPSALALVEQGRADVILQIPHPFEKDLITEKSARVMISANGVDSTRGAFGTSYLTAIITDFNGQIRTELLGAHGQSPSTVNLIPRYRYNPHLKYPLFMVPGLMVMLLTMLCGFLPALNIVGEKEKGTMEQMNVTPVKKSTLILSKLIPFWIIGLVVLSISFVIARLVYDLVPRGSLFSIYLCSWIYILGISGFGLVISNYADTLQQAMFMMFFFVITFIFLSGLYTAIESMPLWAQIVSRFVPLRYMVEIFRAITLRGSGITHLTSPILHLLGFALFFNGWAVLSYSKVD